MKSLKKTLTRDDPKNYYKGKQKLVQKLNPFSKTTLQFSSKPSDILNLSFQTKIPSYNQNYNKLISLIQKSISDSKVGVQVGFFVQSLELVLGLRNKDLDQLLRIIKQFIQHIQKANYDKVFINKANICLDAIRSYQNQSIHKINLSHLNYFNKIMNTLKPQLKQSQIEPQKTSHNDNILQLKLMSSKSNENLGTNRFDNIENKQLKNCLSSQKLAKTNQVRLKSQLTQLLKASSPSPTLNYSAILIASINIQSRNKTYTKNINCQQHKNYRNKHDVTNINRVRMDEAFVFYRPKGLKMISTQLK